jgi:membrane protease YdiL (CAAX protease family)
MQTILLRQWKKWIRFQKEAASGKMFRVLSAPSTIALISIIVGVSEEIMFRAAIQPLLGVWLTSMFFTVVHLNFAASERKNTDWLLALFSIGSIYAISVILGFLFIRFGLLSAIAAHIIYDMLVLLAYRNIFSGAVQRGLESPASETN